jgi:hypothetical protein
MSEETAPTKEPTKKASFSLEFHIPEEMLEVFAKIGLDVVLKQRLKEIEDSVKK